MHRGVRTVLAFVLSPAVAALLVGFFGATFRDEGTGPTWIDAFAQYFLISSLMSYGVSFTAGTSVFATLLFLKRESFGLYVACGAAFGAIYPAVLALGSKSPLLEALALLGVFAGLGAVVAGSFSLIRGTPAKRVPIPVGT
jgi:hypothetical protein